MTNTEQFNDNVVREDESPAVREIISKYVYHWPVFLIATVTCLALAFFYLRYADRIYSVKSTLLIKDDKKGSSAGADLLNDLDLFGSSKVVENEIEILKSKTLMRKVVERLNLVVSFTKENSFNETDFYLKRPDRKSVV